MEVPVYMFRYAAMYEVGLGKGLLSEVRFFPYGLGPLNRIDAIVVRVSGLMVREAWALLQDGYLLCTDGDKTMLETPLHTIAHDDLIVSSAFVLHAPWGVQKPTIRALWPETVKLRTDYATIRVEIYARKR